jgi:hypothetical protein
MGEWTTYSLDDFVMFSPRTWYGLLAAHNRAWWPLQPAVMLLGAGLVWALQRRLRTALRLALVCVGAALLFVGGAFHAGPHAGINLAAPVFGYVFAAQGVALIGLALLRPGLALRPGPGKKGPGRVAFAMLVFALLLYPAVALLSGRPGLQSEWFALAPDPTMLAALALAFMASCGIEGLRQTGRTCALLLALPVAWCAVAGTTAWVLGAPDWWLLPAAALLVCGLSGWHAGRATDRAGLA